VLLPVEGATEAPPALPLVAVVTADLRVRPPAAVDTVGRLAAGMADLPGPLPVVDTVDLRAVATAARPPAVMVAARKASVLPAVVSPAAR
jgi:hypothetical protein